MSNTTKGSLTLNDALALIRIYNAYEASSSNGHTDWGALVAIHEDDLRAAVCVVIGCDQKSAGKMPVIDLLNKLAEALPEFMNRLGNELTESVAPAINRIAPVLQELTQQIQAAE